MYKLMNVTSIGLITSIEDVIIAFSFEVHLWIFVSSV